MSVRLRMRIKDGVEAGLCGSCENSRIMTDIHGHTTVLCEENHPYHVVPIPLKHCSDHLPKGSMNYHQMERAAWIVDVRGGKFIGFKPPKKGEE